MQRNEISRMIGLIFLIFTSLAVYGQEYVSPTRAAVTGKSPGVKWYPVSRNLVQGS